MRPTCSKHALVAGRGPYGTLLRKPRLRPFTPVSAEKPPKPIRDGRAERQAGSCWAASLQTEAGLIEKAAAFSGAKSGTGGPWNTRRWAKAAEQLTACACPDCRLTHHSRAGGAKQIQLQVAAHNSAHACQRIRCAGNQGGFGASTTAD